MGRPPMRHAVSGLVVDQAGTPIKASLEITDENFPHQRVFGRPIETDDAGRFVLQLIEGRRYSLQAVAYNPRLESDVLEVAESGDLSNVRLILHPR